MFTVDVLAPLLNQSPVRICNLLVCRIALDVMREREPGEEEIHWLEAHIEVVIQVGKASIKGITDFLALEGAGSSENGDLRDNLEQVDGARLALQGRVGLEIVGHLLDNEGYVGPELIGSETILDKL